MGDIKSILFVCTGNSCRSIMAEGLLKKYLKESGKNHIEVRSAGIGAIDGFSPTDETIEVMKKEGVDVLGYISKSLTDEMIKAANLILVMDRMHKNDILRRVPSADSKVYLLKEFKLENKPSDMASPNIPDPIGRPLEVYENCLNEIKKEIERIVKLL